MGDRDEYAELEWVVKNPDAVAAILQPQPASSDVEYDGELFDCHVAMNDDAVAALVRLLSATNHVEYEAAVLDAHVVISKARGEA